MIEAILRGKQRPTEDILTSCVFGLLKHLPPEEGLFRFPEHTEHTDGTRPLAKYPLATEVAYSFWPKYSETGCIRCEPDLELRWTAPSQKKWLVMIEAKYLSGKSSEEDLLEEHPYDQLAREWDNLTCRARAQGAEPLLIYLTAHVACPGDDLAASQSEFERKRPGALFQCAWLSWRHLVPALTGQPSFAVSDLNRLMKDLNLVFFNGVTPMDPDLTCGWRFQRDYRWSLTSMQNKLWEFKS